MVPTCPNPRRFRAVMSVYAFTTIFYSSGWFATTSTSSTKRHHIPEIPSARAASAIANPFLIHFLIKLLGLAFYFATPQHPHSMSQFSQAAHCLSRWPRLATNLHRVFYSSIVASPPHGQRYLLVQYVRRQMVHHRNSTVE